MHGANRLGGNSLSDLLVFGARAGPARRQNARRTETEPYLDPVQVRKRSPSCCAARARRRARIPYAIQREMQDDDAGLVGIFRDGADLAEAIERLADLRERWRTSAPRAVAPITRAGTSSSSSPPADGLGGDRAQRARTDREPGAHSRLDLPRRTMPRWGHLNIVAAAGGRWTMTREDTQLPEMTDEQRALLGASDH